MLVVTRGLPSFNLDGYRTHAQCSRGMISFKRLASSRFITFKSKIYCGCVTWNYFIHGQRSLLYNDGNAGTVLYKIWITKPIIGYWRCLLKLKFHWNFSTLHIPCAVNVHNLSVVKMFTFLPPVYINTLTFFQKYEWGFSVLFFIQN